MAVAACCRVLTETPYTLLFVASLWAIVHHLRTGSWRSLILSAILIAAACYIRPSGIAMAVLYALAVLFSRSPRSLPGGVLQRVGLRVLRPVAFSAVVAAALAPWVVRNAVRADYAGFSSFATDSMFRYHAACVHASGPDDMEDNRGVLEDLEDELTPKGATVGKKVRIRAAIARSVIARDPTGVARAHLKGTVGFWLPGAGDVLELAGYVEGQRGTLAVLNAEGLAPAVRHYFHGRTDAMMLAIPLGLVFLVKMFGVAICAVAKVRLRMSADRWLLVGIVLVSALAGGMASTPRFRVPVVPILSVAAAGGWMLVGRWAGRRVKRGA